MGAAASTSAEARAIYNVFFDWRSVRLEPEALAILTAVAKRLGTSDGAGYQVTGYADAKENDRELWRLRAEAVRGAFVRLGVPADKVAIFAPAATEPLLHTADGIREPQERRAEIELK